MRSGRDATRAIVAATTLTLLAAGMFAIPVAAVGGIATSIEITSVEVGSSSAFLPTTFHILTRVAGITEPAPCGTVRIVETTTGTPVELAALDYPCNYGLYFDYTYEPGFGLGTHTFKAIWEITPDIWEDAESAPVDLTITKVDSSVSLSPLGSGTSVEAHHPITIEAGVGAYSNIYDQGASVTFWRAGSATPICTLTAIPYRCTTTFSAPGTYAITAVYSGNTWVNGSTSPPLQVTVVADTVHATGVSVQYSTFYPYKDGYKDTVAIRGSRSEPIGVTIRIYTPGGTRLKTVTFASGTGAYSYAWNGRNSSGTIYGEGKYKVIQWLTDGHTTKVYTFYVNLSKKRIYTYTKTITKLGSSLTAKGYSSGGAISTNTTYGYAKLYAPSYWTSWAGAGWELTLPSATIYKSFYVRVYGRSSGMGTTSVGAQDFTVCPYASGTAWDVSCFGAWRQLSATGGTTLYYYRTASLSTAYRSGTKVRVTVSSFGGTTYIYRAQAVVTYGVLKY